MEFGAGVRHIGQAQALHRVRGPRALQAFAFGGDEGLDAAPVGSAQDGVAHVERAVADEQRGGGAHARLALGFHHIAPGLAAGVGFELQHFGLDRDIFQQVVHAVAGQGADRAADDVAAPVFRVHAEGLQLLLDAVRIEGAQILLVQRHHQGNFRPPWRAGWPPWFAA
jgi:hypothetical protein